MRTAAIAYKLGCMAPKLGKPDTEEEKWLTLAVTATLTTMEKVMQVPGSSTSGEEPENLNVMRELRLPAWASMHDLAAPFEALGTFYMTHDRNIA